MVFMAIAIASWASGEVPQRHPCRRVRAGQVLQPIQLAQPDWIIQFVFNKQVTNSRDRTVIH